MNVCMSVWCVESYGDPYGGPYGDPYGGPNGDSYSYGESVILDGMGLERYYQNKSY